MSSSPVRERSTATKRSPRMRLVGIAVAIAIVIVVIAAIALLISSAPPSGPSPPPQSGLTLVVGSSMTWTVYDTSGVNASLPFMVYVWNVTSISGSAITVNETSYVVGSGVPAHSTAQLTADDFKTGPSGVTSAGLTASGTELVSTAFGNRTCNVFNGSASYLLYTANVELLQGASKGVSYVADLSVNNGLSTLRLSYVLTAGNVPEL